MAILEGRRYSRTAKLLPSVRQWLDWKITNVLPRAGGTLDQDAEFMADLRMINTVEANIKQHKAEMEKLEREVKSRRR